MWWVWARLPRVSEIEFNKFIDKMAQKIQRTKAINTESDEVQQSLLIQIINP